MPGKEARAAEKRLAALLAAKWQRQYSEMVSYVRMRMSLSIVRSVSLCLRGDRSGSWRRGSADGVAAGAIQYLR